MKTDYKQFEKAVYLFINKWKRILRISHELDLKKDDSNETPFEIAVRFPYSSSTISFNDVAVEDWRSKFKLQGIPQCSITEYSVVHEQIHILVTELDSVARQRFATEKEVDNAEETVVDRLTLIILRLFYGRENEKQGS